MPSAKSPMRATATRRRAAAGKTRRLILEAVEKFYATRGFKDVPVRELAALPEDHPCKIKLLHIAGSVEQFIPYLASLVEAEKRTRRFDPEADCATAARTCFAAYLFELPAGPRIGGKDG